MYYRKERTLIFKEALMDKFFSQKTCDRCCSNLDGGRIMSMFNTDCICITCSEKEKQNKNYDKAVEADHMQIRKGNYNFKGIEGGE